MSDYNGNSPELHQLLLDANLKIQEALKEISGGDAKIALEVLREHCVLIMGSVCKDCRRAIARQLKREIPNILAEANRDAAINAATPTLPRRARHHWH